MSPRLEAGAHLSTICLQKLQAQKQQLEGKSSSTNIALRISL